jgi:uncharacterized protein (TIGR03083 family)
LIDKKEILRSVRHERHRTISMLRELAPASFDTPTALPGWRVREVVGHLVSTDRAAVTGTILPQVFGSMEKLEAWNDRQARKWSGRPVPELLVALDRWGLRFARLAGALPGALYGVRLPSMLGRGPLGLLIWVRAYDEWVHRQDIRRALGEADEDTDLASVTEFLLSAVGVDTVARLRNEAGPDATKGRVVLSLTGTPVQEWGFDLASAMSGPDLAAGADARVEAPAPAFIMAAAGRDPFSELEGRGVLAIEGDADLARRFLARLRIV